VVSEEREGAALHPECWVWEGPRWKAGYGRIGRSGYAHRFAYAKHKGPIPEGMVVRHRCDNPPCWNPEHLVLGTHAENMADMARRGRACSGARKSEIMKRVAARGDNHAFRRRPELCARGERSGHAKLTKDAVREIRAKYAAGGTSHARLAAEYGVAAGTIQDVLERRTWRHVA
jgi:hypothetical protein